jgi:hypothetical protein
LEGYLITNVNLAPYILHTPIWNPPEQIQY